MPIDQLIKNVKPLRGRNRMKFVEPFHTSLLKYDTSFKGRHFNEQHLAIAETDQFETIKPISVYCRPFSRTVYVETSRGFRSFQCEIPRFHLAHDFDIETAMVNGERMFKFLADVKTVWHAHEIGVLSK